MYICSIIQTYLIPIRLHLPRLHAVIFFHVVSPRQLGEHISHVGGAVSQSNLVTCLEVPCPSVVVFTAAGWIGALDIEIIHVEARQCA